MAADVLASATSAAKELVDSAAVTAKELVASANKVSEKIRDEFIPLLVSSSQRYEEHIIKLEQHMVSDTRIFEELKSWIMGQGPSIPGLAGRLDRIEQRELSRNKHFFIIYAAIIGLLVGIVAKAVINP